LIIFINPLLRILPLLSFKIIVILQGVVRVKAFGELRDWLCRESDAPLVLEIDEKGQECGDWEDKVQQIPLGQVKKSLVSKKNESSNSAIKAEDQGEEDQEERKRQQVMKNMAQLWLQQEVCYKLLTWYDILIKLML